MGTTDTRGDRGIVAVAERGGGRVRLLHYAPALRPFYQAELTHLHRLVETLHVSDGSSIYTQMM